jgi:hypothetical protein
MYLDTVVPINESLLFMIVLFWRKEPLLRLLSIIDFFWEVIFLYDWLGKKGLKRFMVIIDFKIFCYPSLTVCGRLVSVHLVLYLFYIIKKGPLFIC